MKFDRVDMLVSEHLRTQMKSNPHFDFENSKKKFSRHLPFPTLQKSFNSMKEWERYGVFGIRGFNVW